MWHQSSEHIDSLLDTDYLHEVYRFECFPNGTDPRPQE